MRAGILGVVLLGCFFAVACGGDDGGEVPDAAQPDARLGFDANENLIDAGPVTVCGDLPDQMECNTLTEICVLTDTGGSLQPSCEVCDQDTRDCASCSALCVGLTCGDSADENTIECF